MELNIFKIKQITVLMKKWCDVANYEVYYSNVGIILPSDINE